MGFAGKLFSAALTHAAYLSERSELMVRYANGRCYLYRGVPAAVAAGLLSTRSPGRYVREHEVRSFEFVEVDSARFDAAFRDETLSPEKGFVLGFEGMRGGSFLRRPRSH
jgi:hypothetical protein